MTPTSVLIEEHGGIDAMMGILGKICDRLDAGEYPDAGHIERILEFLRVFVDACHHGKEEEFLFPEVGDVLDPGGRSLVEDLLKDHRDGRSMVQRMEEAFPRARTGDGPAVNRLTLNARRYIALLRSHIDREEKELFPRVDASLTEERRKDLVAEFERIEEERIGRGRHEEFHRLLDRLKESYAA